MEASYCNKRRTLRESGKTTMELFIISAALISSSVAISSTTKYCSTALCRSGERHIACGHNGTFSAICSSDAAMVAMDEKLKSLIIAYHNNKRNFIAGGGDAKLKKACRMTTMQWDDELAALAALNVKQCTMAHDRCHNTETLKFSGQNLGWIGYYGQANATQLLEKTLNMWYNERKYSNMTYISSYPSSYKGPVIGHFTVMMADRNIRTGCAISTYSKSGVRYKYFLVACNYATTNMVKFPIYTSCTSAAADCTTGTNPKYPNLCSPSEIYNVNKWYR